MNRTSSTATSRSSAGRTSGEQSGVLRIATRRSPLALWQAEHVRVGLEQRFAQLRCELVPLKTTGDRLLDAPLAKVGGKGLFVKELEQALYDGRADLAVHSVKDIPVSLPEGLHLAVILAREDPRDALVFASGADPSGASLVEEPVSLARLPRGAVVGTSSLRRRSQLLAARPDLRIHTIRGSVQTRLDKLDAGEVDALVLASAGLKRLGLEHRIGRLLSISEMLPAIGQGALGIECRQGDERVESYVMALHEPAAACCVLAERALNERLEGGCQVPVAAHARLTGETLLLDALVASECGDQVLREHASGSADEAEAVGRAVGDGLLAQGAGRILRALGA